MDDTVFAGPSPWQMWGNTQVVAVEPNAFTNPNANDKPTTLLRVNYNRPETWRFLFAARILNAPAAGPGEQGNLSVWFELYTGIGRSAIRLPFFVTLPGWTWLGGPTAAPNDIRWTTKALTSDVALTVTSDPAGVELSTSIVPVFSELIVGQDMTVVAHPTFTTNIPGAVPANIEVSGQFAPNTHVRPDWFQVDATAGEQFPGGEIKGR
jgi:hypothetical protein